MYKLKTNKKPKKRAVFSATQSVASWLAEHAGQVGLRPRREACAFRMGCPRALGLELALPACERAVERSGVRVFRTADRTHRHHSPPTAHWPCQAGLGPGQGGCCRPRTPQSGELRTLAQDWLLCWVLASGPRWHARPFGAFFPFFFPGAAGSRCPSPAERAERYDLPLPLWLSPPAAAQLCIVSHPC